MDIRLIRHEEIDKTKWNSCVHYATNGNIFGYKWYLDAIAKEWDALVEGDYESVLPLFLTEYDDQLLQPNLIREGGIYSINLLSQKRVNAFLKAIPEQYSNLRIRLNEGISSTDETYSIIEKRNHQLILVDPYEKITSNYSARIQAILQSQKQKALLPSANVKPEKIAQLFLDHSSKSQADEATFHGFQRIMYNALHRGWGATFGVTNRSKELLCAAFFLYSQGRVMQLVATTTVKGQAAGAYEYLLDNFMQSHAGRPLVLDFNTFEDYPTLWGARSNVYLELEKGLIKNSKPLATTIKKKGIWAKWFGS